MSAFFELRIYKVFPGMMKKWLDFMENTIIPYQVAKGMVIHGSFEETSFDSFFLSNGKRETKKIEDRNIYIWIRRFENQKHKEKLYKKVYESKEWTTEIAPIVEKLIDRNSIVVHNICSTKLSTMK